MQSGPVESEIKLRLAGPDEGRAALRRLGAELATARHLEDNQLYDDERRSLMARGCVLRLRRTPHETVLTFKGPKRLEQGVRSREELETTLGSGAFASLILERLGLRPTFHYQKYRETWRHGALTIVLDETVVGTFFELEGEPREIHLAAAALGYGRSDYVNESYVALYLQAGGQGDMLVP